ncbi:MAG TPA: hypothetical protein DIT24_03585 [Synergistaceae bacterium]|nr:hypothetical protein [Synergistaceae bacterium]
MEEIMPMAAVRFQNSMHKNAGRFAEAATVNAHPTTKDTFISPRAIPRTIPRSPIATETTRPADKQGHGINLRHAPSPLH